MHIYIFRFIYDTCICIYISIFMCIYVYIYMYMCVFYICIYMYMYICIYIYVYICIYIYIYVYVCIWIYIYIHMCFYISVSLCWHLSLHATSSNVQSRFWARGEDIHMHMHMHIYIYIYLSIYLSSIPDPSIKASPWRKNPKTSIHLTYHTYDLYIHYYIHMCAHVWMPLCWNLSVLTEP